MKILFISEFFPLDEKLKFTGGVESYNYYLVRQLSKIASVIVLCRKTKEISPYQLNPNLMVIPIGPLTRKVDTSFVTIPGRIIFILSAIWYGLQQDFDIVQGNNFVVYPVAFIVGLIKNKPKIAWYPDVFLGRWIKNAGFLSGFVGEIMERAVLLLSWTHFVALSESTRNKLINAGIDSKKITTISAGVDLRYFDKIYAKKKEIPTIICISRLVSYKRVDLLIEACGLLKNQGLNFKLEIVGDGPEKETLKGKIIAVNLSEDVSIRSNLGREELAIRLKSADLLCHPSEQEGFGLVVIEGCASKVPYVISDIDVLVEITKNGYGGLVFKKGNLQDLADKIEILIKDEKLRKKKAMDAYKLATEYSWEKIANKFLKIYAKFQN